MKNKSKKGAEGDVSRTYDLAWAFDPRIVTDHLGRAKYASGASALGELISNAFDAGARRVDIDTTPNQLGGLQSIRVADNGIGMSPTNLHERFRVVGVAPAPGAGTGRMGRFGVGRLAVLRLGSHSDWTTVATDGPRGRAVQSKFTLRSDSRERVSVTEEPAQPGTPTGTTIEIFNLIDEELETVFATRMRGEILSQFCAYLLTNPDRTIRVQGEPLDVLEFIEHREQETLEGVRKVSEPVQLNHIFLRKPLDETRVAGRVLFTSKGRTVAACSTEFAPSNNYLGIVESAYLDKIVLANREAVAEMDPGFAGIKEAALGQIAAFSERYREAHKRTFLEKAREQSYYPFRAPPVTAVDEARRAVYDVVLERVNEHANVEGMTQRQQAVLFRLLNRSLENEDLLVILNEIASLTNDDMDRFRRVLEKTTLQSLIRLSSEVTGRLQFLDALHELVYGELGPTIKERSQLHKIIDSHCWVFGPAYHLATSDKSFREVIRRHREMAGLEPTPDREMKEISGVSDIPDLFLAAKREYPIQPRSRHLLVELKAPRVSLGWKEFKQVTKYAQTVMGSSQFDRSTTHWDVHLVSTEVADEIEAHRRQKDKPVGLVAEYENASVWIFTWGEVIDRARSEMRLVSEHLEAKSKELSVSKYLQENFPEVLGHEATAQRP